MDLIAKASSVDVMDSLLYIYSLTAIHRAVEFVIFMTLIAAYQPSDYFMLQAIYLVHEPAVVGPSA